MTPLEYIYLASIMLGGGYLALASVLHVIGGGDHGHDVDGDLDVDAHGLDVDAGGLDVDAGGLDVDAGGLDVDAGGFDVDAGELDVDAGGFDVDVDADGLDADVDAGDLDGHADHTAGGEAEHAGVSFLSPLVMSTLMFGFGVMGFLVDHWVAGAVVGLAAAAGGALLGGGGTYWSLNKLSRVEGGSATKVRRLIGHQADVSVAVPDRGFGEIVYVQNQTRYNAPARSRGGVAIPKGARVFISTAEGSSFVVEEAKADRIRRIAAARAPADGDDPPPSPGPRARQAEGRE